MSSPALVDRQLVNATIRQIDYVNSTDPNLDPMSLLPLALHQGRLASTWLSRLHRPPDTPSLELELVVRAHHLRRWELARIEYPEGRTGYLQWRRDNKRHQAESLAAIMSEFGWSRQSIIRTTELLSRTQLRTDPETQHLEDAACLVFLETEFQTMVDRLEPDHMSRVIEKTLAKMSPLALEFATPLIDTATTDASGS